MPLLRYFNGKNQRLNTLGDRIDYVKNEKATGGVVERRGVLEGREKDSFLIIKQLYRKEGGRQSVHFVISFSKGECYNSEHAHQIGCEILEEILPDYQVLMGVHSNTENLHLHFLVNSVSYRTGRKFQSSPKDLKKLRQTIEKIVCGHQIQGGIQVDVDEKVYNWTEESIIEDADSIQASNSSVSDPQWNEKLIRPIYYECGNQFFEYFSDIPDYLLSGEEIESRGEESTRIKINGAKELIRPFQYDDEEPNKLIRPFQYDDEEPNKLIRPFQYADEEPKGTHEVIIYDK